MKRTILLLALGILVGEFDPVGWLAWKWIGARLPQMKADSLAKASPFDEVPPSNWIAESPNAYVIEDQYAPTAPVHLLVIPKERYTTILEPPTEVLAEMFDLAREAARKKNIDESGFRIIVNTNEQGGQGVYHLHIHVVGGRQLTEPLLPLIWGRLTHLDNSV